MRTDGATERGSVEGQFSDEAAVILENHSGYQRWVVVVFLIPERTGTTGH